MGVSAGWASSLDGLLRWMGILVGWASSLDGPHRWMGVLRWMGVFAEWVSSLDKRPCRIRIFAGWVSRLDWPPCWIRACAGLATWRPRWLGVLAVVARILQHICMSHLILASSGFLQFHKCMPLVYSHVLHVVRGSAAFLYELLNSSPLCTVDSHQNFVLNSFC